MITKKTVLILGAGASDHVGYPMGSELVSKLCDLRGTVALNELPEEWPRDIAEHFLTRLSRAGHYSIDAFLEAVPEHAALGKYLIARQLKKCEIIEHLFRKSSMESWYQYLFNQLIEGRSDEAFGSDNLGIITFNYDRSLEAYLHHALQARFSVTSESASSIMRRIPILHVHGILGLYPDVPYTDHSSADELRSISQKIQIIHEIHDSDEEFCNESFKAAHGMLLEAEQIFFLGFGFHPDNIRRFKFFTADRMKDRLVRATISGVKPVHAKALAARMKLYGFPEDINKWGTEVACNQFFSYVQALE